MTAADNDEPTPVAPRFEEFQFVVVPVLLQCEDGKVPRAVQAEQVVLAGVEELLQFAEFFQDRLRELNVSAEAGA